MSDFGEKAGENVLGQFAGGEAFCHGSHHRTGGWKADSGALKQPPALPEPILHVWAYFLV
jgi:hypothetical protein